MNDVRAMPVNFALACPVDRTPLQIGNDVARCLMCGCIYSCTDGIWRFLHREAVYENFLETYRVVRHAEGWRSHDAAYYRNLPRTSPDDPRAAIWRVRAASFQKLIKLIAQNDRILDVGAGNAWLSHQLARRGHCIAAVDLNDDAEDGLGAIKFYPTRFDCYQADYDHLPFGAAQFDVVIFNASLHYSTDLHVTLDEGLRVLKARGKIVVMDSPLYRQRASGTAMLREKANEFKTRYGLDMEQTMRGFLTFDDFQPLPCEWQWHETFVNVRWVLRPYLARWRKQREPARFGLMVGRPSTR